MGYAFVIVLIICILEFIYILRMKKQEKNWLEILKGISQGRQDKIFTNDRGNIADISYEINSIIDSGNKQIIKLKKADEASKQILTSLSHDVRTPLASLLGYLEALNKGMDNEGERQEYIGVAFRKANDLKAYVDILFEWFKLNSNEQEFVLERIDINEITRKIIIEWLPMFENNKIDYSVDIGDEENLVCIDLIAYSRVINNLIANAGKHGRCTSINVSVKENGESVFVSVKNNGNIIPPEQLPHIFERLYKGDTARADKGSGLGLAIAKELVGAFEGEITASSSQEETVFTLRLPLCK